MNLRIKAHCQGGVSTAMAGVTSVPGAIRFRIVLGVLESGFFPGVMLLMSCWYKVCQFRLRVRSLTTADRIAGGNVKANRHLLHCFPTRRSFRRPPCWLYNTSDGDGRRIARLEMVSRALIEPVLGICLIAGCLFWRDWVQSVSRHPPTSSSQVSSSIECVSLPSAEAPHRLPEHHTMAYR